MSKVVFVGNVPYNMGEEQLIEAFKSVGQVVGFRLVFDRDTGKPKGYGFCEFADHDTALSAVRNLNGQEVGGRPLRIDLADSDPFLEGKTTIRGEIVDAHETRAQWRERERERRDAEHGGGGGGHHHRGGGGRHSKDPAAFLSKLPRGVHVPPGSTALDIISVLLGRESPPQILEVLAQMKAFVINHPESARSLLAAHPQLGYALFQALLLNNIVDPTILNRMLAATGAPAPPPPSAVPSNPPPMAPQHYPPPVQHAPPPQPTYGMPPPHLAGPPAVGNHPKMYGHMPPPAQLPPYYGRPGGVPPPQQMPPQAQPPPPVQQQPPPAAAGYDQTQRDMLAQVLALTQEQINSLPPMERDQIIQLRKQFGVST